MSIKRTFARILFLFSLIIICGISSHAQSPAREYQVKAAFVFNFTQFVEWPASSFSSPQAPLVIGVLGKPTIGSYLEEVVSGEKANGHPLLVHYYNNLDDIKGCHILFISQTESNKAEQAIAIVKGSNILTVSDANNFMQQGGMIRMFTKNNKMQLQVNLDATKTANLVISSKLLRLAEIFVGK